jgi:hypothetical protein
MMPILHAAVSAMAFAAAVSSATTSTCHNTKQCDARQQAKDLLKQMTWEEKIGQMGGVRRVLSSGTTVNPQYDTTRKMQNGQLGKLPYLIFHPPTIDTYRS